MIFLKSTKMFAIACALICSQQSLNAQIAIDGNFADWDSVPVLASSPTPDGGVFDIHELKVTNDEANFYFYISLHDTVGVDMTQVRFSIDTDNSTATGHELNNEFAGVPVGTVGVDLLVTNDFPVSSTAAAFWGAGGIPPFGGGFLAASNPAGAVEREWSIPRSITFDDGSGPSLVFGDSFTVSAWTWEADGQALAPTLYETPPPVSVYLNATIDGDTSEWAGVPVFAVDAADNAGSIDFTSMQVANDEDFVYIRYLVNESISSANFAGVFKSVDEDDDFATGFNLFGANVAGVEASWQGNFPFENGTGIFNTLNGLTSAATLMSSLETSTGTLDVELAIDRTTFHTVGGANVFPADGDEIAVALWTDQGLQDFIGGGTYALASSSSTLLGDVDLSGEVNFLDIAPFIAVLSGSTYQAEADCDENGVIEFLDIAPFIAILSSI